MNIRQHNRIRGVNAKTCFDNGFKSNENIFNFHNLFTILGVTKQL